MRFPPVSAVALVSTSSAVSAAENAGDQKAASALMTDAGIAAFYQGTTRADLEAGKAEGFGQDPPRGTIGRDSAYGPIGTMDSMGNRGPIRK